MSQPATIRQRGPKGKTPNARKIFGMPPKDCPKCGAMGGVIDTRVTTNEQIWRRRICKRGHRWTTVEVYLSKTQRGEASSQRIVAEIKRKLLKTIIKQAAQELQ